jgi:AcrR family transcriptional regulator
MDGCEGAVGVVNRDDETETPEMKSGSLPVADLLSPEKQAQVLAGATIVFARDGYEGASMSDIARAAGVSKGTLYNYFDSKAELFAAYVQQECRQKLTILMSATDSDDSPAEVLSRIATRMLEITLSPSGLTVYRVVIAEAEKFPNLARTFYEAGPARVMAFLSTWLAEETRRGRLAVPDPDLAAEQFLALCQTRLAIRRKLAMIESPSAAEVQHIAAATVSMFLKTYTA